MWRFEQVELFDSYNFTVIKDTPHDSGIAIDPWNVRVEYLKIYLKIERKRCILYIIKGNSSLYVPTIIINYLLNFYGEDSLEDIKSLVIEKQIVNL